MHTLVYKVRIRQDANIKRHGASSSYFSRVWECNPVIEVTVWNCDWLSIQRASPVTRSVVHVMKTWQNAGKWHQILLSNSCSHTHLSLSSLSSLSLSSLSPFLFLPSHFESPSLSSSLSSHFPFLSLSSIFSPLSLHPLPISVSRYPLSLSLLLFSLSLSSLLLPNTLYITIQLLPYPSSLSILHQSPTLTDTHTQS